MDNITQRDAFWNRIYELAKVDHNIIVVTADMGAPSLDKFRTDLPSQFVNVGIAEQNGILIAAGLAMSGKRPFVYAIAPFITLRCLEQIRVESCIMNIPITVVGVGAGFGYEDSGPTHHLTEDIAILRAMPNIVIHSISDNVMAKAIAEMSCTMAVTNYIRLDRLPSPDIYDEGTDFSEGLAVLSEGQGGYIVSTGNMVHTAIEAAKELEQKGVCLGVIDIYAIPINQRLLIEKLGQARRVITLEEHFLAGGLGSAVCEVLIDAEQSMPVKRLGLCMEKGYCYEYGGRDIIRKYYGIDKNGVVKQVEDFISANDAQLAFNEK